jgi:hypothetical protein
MNFWRDKMNHFLEFLNKFETDNKNQILLRNVIGALISVVEKHEREIKYLQGKEKEKE